LPEPLKDGNLGESWERFKREFQQFLVATERDASDTKIKTAILLRVIGSRGNDIYENFNFDEATDKTDFAKVIAKFEEFCKPRNEKFISRHRLLNMRQDGLAVDQYETKLRSQARVCEFGQLTDDLTCHAFVEGVDDKGLKDKLLTRACEGNLDLATAVRIAREYESARAHMKEIAKDQEEQVNSMRVGHYPINYNNSVSGNSRNNGQVNRVDRGSGLNYKVKCNYCGRDHVRGAKFCPAYGKVCNKCQKKNHFGIVCKADTGGATSSEHSRDCKVMSDGAEKYFDELLMMECTAQTDRKQEMEEVWALSGGFRVCKVGKRLLVDFERDQSVITCQLDTAAARNIVSFDEYKKWNHPKLSPSNVTLVTYDGTELKSKGRATVSFDHIKAPITFEVIDTHTNPRPLLGIDTCLELGLINVSEQIHAMGQHKVTRESLLSEFEDVFMGLGEMPGEYDIQVDPTVVPVQHRPRKVPVALKEEVIKKIKLLEEQQVLHKVEEPTPWISSLVALKKPNGTIRPCLDPKDLNRAIVRNHYQIPTIEDVLPKLTKAKCFSLLDAKDGFLQVKLSERSKKLTTFWTPVGRYCWNRLPFGLSSSPEEYQRRLHTVLDGLDGTQVIADDILVYGVGETEEEARENHDDNILQVMKRIRDNGVKLNRDKMKLHLKELKYMGHILTTNGIKPDPAKVQSIKGMPIPEDKKSMKRFLGAVTYLGRFIPNLSQVAEPLRNLTKESSKWSQLGETELGAIERLKDLISEDAELRYFDTTKSVHIECDASYDGLGAVMLQDDKPVCYASRTLTEVEKRYHPMELECLAVLFACSKFDQYIYGNKEVRIFSDHQPLESIFKKDMDKSPLRLQKMLLTLQRYGLDLEYKPTYS